MESAEARKHKRIVEHWISGFDNAKEAIAFGKTVNILVDAQADGIKFNQFIGTEETILAITDDWTGSTVLKTSFLDILDQNTAQFICKTIKDVIGLHENIHKDSVLKVMKEIIRDKPQPQFIGT